MTEPVRSALVDDLLRPVRLARDVERGLLGHILGRLEWPEQRYPMLAAWTEQWSRPAGEQPDSLPLVHARHPQPGNTSTRVEVHTVTMRRADPPRPVPVVQAERRRSEPTRVAATTPRDERSTLPHAAPGPTAQTAATPRTPAAPAPTSHATAAPPTHAAAPSTSSVPLRPREPAPSTRETSLPRVVSAFRRDRPTNPAATPVRPAPVHDLSPGPGEPALTHPAAPRDLSPGPAAASPAAPHNLSPSTGVGPRGDLSPGPGEPPRGADAGRSSLAPPRTVTPRLDAVTIDPPLVHAARAAEASAAPSPVTDASGTDAPHAAPRLAPVPRVAATPSSPSADPQLVHAQAAGPTPAAPHAQDDAQATALPHPTTRPRVASRRAVTARAPQPAPTIAARWVADDDAPPLHRPRTTARPAQAELPHVVTPAPVAPQPARRPVPEASPATTAARSTPTTTTTTTTPQPPARPALDVDAVVDTTMRRLGRELERARGLRKALR